MTTTPSVVDAEPAVHMAGAALRVVVVNGSPNQPSKTMGLVEVVLDTLKEMLPIETSRIDVYRLRAHPDGSHRRGGPPRDPRKTDRRATPDA